MDFIRGRGPAPMLVLAWLTLAPPALAQAPASAAPPAPPPADTLSLEEAVDRALSRSPAIRSARAQRTLRSASRWESWGSLIPSLQLSTGVNQSAVLQRTVTDPITGGIIALPDSLIDLRETYGTSAALSLNWTIFDGGRRIWNIRQAQAEARAANLSLQAAAAQIAANVTLAYLTALEARALADTRAAELQRATELMRLAEGRFEVGAVPELDVLQARLAAGDAEMALLEARAAAEAAELALLEYVPMPDAEEIALTAPEIPELGDLPPAEQLRECTLEASPALDALQAEVSAARRQVERERFWMLPTVSFGTTWVRSEFGQTREAITFEPRNEQTYYRLSLSWTPLDQPGQVIAANRRASAALHTAQAELTSRRAAMVREVSLAIERLRLAEQMRERRALNLQVAELQRQQAEERYRLGAGSIVERFQAEALAREAERQAIIARYAVLRGLAELELASGVRVVNGEWGCG